MGIQVKRKKDKYKLISGISDKRIHDKKWITLEEAKKILIDRAFVRFMENVCEIGMDFPTDYVNDKLKRYPKTQTSFREWWLYHGCETDPLYNKFKEIADELNIDYLKKLM